MKTYKEFYEAIKNMVRQRGKSNFIPKDAVEQIIDEFEMDQESYSTSHREDSKK